MRVAGTVACRPAHAHEAGPRLHPSGTCWGLGCLLWPVLGRLRLGTDLLLYQKTHRVL